MDKSHQDDYALFASDASYTIPLLTKKQIFFNICSALIPKAHLPPFAASTLIFLSLMQFLALVFAARFENESIILTLIKITRLFPLIEDLGSVLWFYCGYVLIGVVILICALMIVLKFRNALNPFLATFAYLVQFVYWIGFIPIMELFLSVWNCEDNKLIGAQCWDIIHDIIIAITCVLLLSWMLVITVFTFVTGYSQPHRQDPFAHYPWKFELYYSILRILYVLSVRFSVLKYMEIPLLVITIPYFINILWRSYPYYHPTVAYGFAVGIFCNIVGGVAAAVKLGLGWLDIETDKLIGVAAVIFLLILFFTPLSQRIWYKKIISIDQAKNTIETDSKIHFIRNILIEGTRYFDDQNEFLTMQSSKYEESNSTDIPSEEKLISFQHQINPYQQIDSAQNNKKRVISLISRHNLRDDTDISFMLRMAGIFLNLVGNMHMAYKTLIDIEKNDPCLLDQLDIYLQERDIQLVTDCQSAKSMRKNGFCKFQKLIQYESEFDKLRKKMIEQAEIRIDFWSIIKSRPSLNKLHVLGLKMIHVNKEVKETWETLNTLNPYHVNSLSLYKSYTENVIGDNEELANIERKIQIAEIERSIRPFSLGELFSDDVCVMAITTEDSKILRASKTVSTIFQYDPKELEGKSVNVIMPPLISQYHKRYMEAYYKNVDCRASGTTLKTFALNRNGYIIPINLAVQPFFGFITGLIYIGAIKFEPIYDEMIITDTKGKIAGITGKICKKLQLTPLIIAERKIHIQQICHELSTDSIPAMEGTMNLRFSSSIDKINSLSMAAKKDSIKSKKEDSSSVLHYAKCEVKTVRYSQGLTLKVVTIGKSLDENEKGRKKGIQINLEMISTIQTIMKAVRKFKSMAIKASMNKNNDEYRSHPNTRISMSKLIINNNKNDPQSLEKTSKSNVFNNEEEKSTPRATNKDTTEPFLSTKGERISGKNKLEPIFETPSKNYHKELIHKATKNLEKRNESQRKPSPSQNLMAIGLASNYMKSGSLIVRDIDKNSVSSSIYRNVANIRKRSAENSKTSTVAYLRVATELFILLILILLGVRVGISIWFNSKIVNYGTLMIDNDDRLSAAGLLAGNLQLLTLYFPLNQYTNTSFMNENTGFAKYAHQGYMILENAKVSTYKEYMENQARNAIEMVLTSERNIRHSLGKYDRGLVKKIDWEPMNLTYSVNNIEFELEFKIQDAIYTIISVSLKLLEKITTNTYNYTDYEGSMAISNIVSNFVKGIRWTADFILEEAYNTIGLHGNFSLSSFMALLGVYAVYFIVIIPFLYLTNRDLVAMLMLFLDISKPDISGQLDKVSSFIKMMYRSERMQKVDYAIEDTTQNGEKIDNQEDQDEKVEDENTENEESSEKDDKHEKHKRHTNSKVKSYVPYKSNMWKLMLLFIVFSGFVIGVYAIMDYFSKNVGKVMAFKVSELKRLLRLYYTGVYTGPYLYSFIMTSKQGMCGFDKCLTYLPGHFESRQTDLYDFMLVHKGNQSLISDSYNNFFVNLFEKNPCKLPEFSNITQCEKHMGGIFSVGLQASIVRHLDIASSIYREYASTQGTNTDIENYMNDARLVDAHILSEQFITPALIMGIHFIHNSLQDDFSYDILLTAGLLSVFVLGFLIISISWLIWLTNFIQDTMFGTKLLLTNLPDDIILRNDSIQNYLTMAIHNGDPQ